MFILSKNFVFSLHVGLLQAGVHVWLPKQFDRGDYKTVRAFWKTLYSLHIWWSWAQQGNQPEHIVKKHYGRWQ